MSVDRYKYELFKEKFKKADIDALLEQSMEIGRADRKNILDDLFFKPTPTPEYKKRYGTLGRLIEQLQEAERYLGSDVEIFIRDKDGIHQPQIVIEQTPNELPVDKIVTIQ